MLSLHLISGRTSYKITARILTATVNWGYKVPPKALYSFIKMIALYRFILTAEGNLHSYIKLCYFIKLP